MNGKVNEDNGRIERRAFLSRSAAVAAGIGATALTGIAAAATPDAIEEAVAKVGRLPRRKLGTSGREIAMVVGAFVWPSDLVEAGARCGMNYWHRVNGFKTIPPAILKNREAHYCQVSVDRVRGNHETGQIVEEEHYQYVKQALRDTGLSYFDDMQFRFGYHTAAEVKQNRGMIRAFERLKKEGVVKHLCLSQHSYNGNALVPGGQSAPEVLTALIEDGAYEHYQIMYSYGDDKASSDAIALAKRKGQGVIAMKTGRGVGRMGEDAAFMKRLPAGTTPHRALVRWLAAETPLDAVTVNTQTLEQFVENYAGMGAPLRAEERRAIEMMRAYADQRACRLCNECMEGCRQQINIADIMRYERYARDYKDIRAARYLYAKLPRQGDACTACGECPAKCPQGLRIPEKLAEIHRLLA